MNMIDLNPALYVFDDPLHIEVFYNRIRRHAKIGN